MSYTTDKNGFVEKTILYDRYKIKFIEFIIINNAVVYKLRIYLRNTHFTHKIILYNIIFKIILLLIIRVYLSIGNSTPIGRYVGLIHKGKNEFS